MSHNTLSNSPHVRNNLIKDVSVASLPQLGLDVGAVLDSTQRHYGVPAWGYGLGPGENTRRGSLDRAALAPAASSAPSWLARPAKRCADESGNRCSFVRATVVYGSEPGEFRHAACPAALIGDACFAEHLALETARAPFGLRAIGNARRGARRRRSGAAGRPSRRAWAVIEPGRPRRRGHRCACRPSTFPTEPSGLTGPSCRRARDAGGLPTPSFRSFRK